MRDAEGEVLPCLVADLRQATVFLAALFLILQIGGKNIFSSGSPLGIL